MKIIVIIVITVCTKNNFIYNTQYKNDIEYCFNNLHKLSTNDMPSVIEKAKNGDNKALFLYIYLLGMYPNNENLKSKVELLENINNLIEYLSSNNEFLVLGILYSSGIKGYLVPDANKAIIYYNNDINMSNSRAAYYLGLLYEKGIIEQLSPNINKAIEYYIKATDAGHSNSAY